MRIILNLLIAFFFFASNVSATLIADTLRLKIEENDADVKLNFIDLIDFIENTEKINSDFSLAISHLLERFSDEKGSYAPPLMVYWILSGKVFTPKEALHALCLKASGNFAENTGKGELLNTLIYHLEGNE